MKELGLSSAEMYPEEGDYEWGGASFFYLKAANCQIGEDFREQGLRVAFFTYLKRVMCFIYFRAFFFASNKR